MKKSLLALAALTAFAGAASAQSSVTLFGVVDLNARNVKNGTDAINSLSTDGNASSRLGFRGVEDLGGGLRAGFWLEAGLAADNGTIGGGNGGANSNAAGSTGSAASASFFNRRSTVSLLGAFGEVRLGRDYTPTFWNHTIFDVFGTNGVGSSTNIISRPAAPAVTPFNGGAQTLVRANNSIGYFLPALGGVYGQVMVAAGEKQNPSNQYLGGRIGYAGGPVNVAVSYGITKKGDGTVNPAMLDDMKAMNVGGSFNAGFLTVYGQYNKYDEGAKSLKNYSLGVGVPVGPGNIKASYGSSDYESPVVGTTPAVKATSTQFAFGYVYDMSKRTSIYAHYAQIDNDAGNAYTASTGGPALAATGFKSTGYELGVRHSF